MSFEALQERLTALQETTAQVKELIDRLATLKFQPGSVPLGTGDEDNVATELSSEINQILREEEDDLELLQEEITDMRSGRPGSEAEHRKKRLKEGGSKLETELKSCRVTFHKAQLTAKRSLESAQRLERELLLASYSKAPSTPGGSRSGANSPSPSLHMVRRRQTNKSTKSDDPLVSASSDLTQSLRRANQLVTEELSRSIAVHETLQESTAQLKTLGTTYGRLDDMLTSSRDLLGVLMKSTKSDTWYLQNTFYMLLITLGWLVFRRFLYGPMWWLVWLPLRLMFGTGWRVGSAVGKLGVSGSGARMEVVVGNEKGQSATVVDMDEGAVPTIQVSQEVSETEVDPNSMVEKVGRIIDGKQEEANEANAEGDDVVVNSSEDDPPNTKKRTWEEEREAPKEAGRVKNEL